jgi:hypothetical protein
MVLGARLGVYGGGQFEIVGAVADYSRNMGGSLLFKVEPLPYTFYFDLFMLNYAPVTSLPSTTVESSFRLEDVYLLIDDFGYIASEYIVRLGQRYALYIVYGVEIRGKNISLNHHNALARYPIPTPVSFLL